MNRRASRRTLLATLAFAILIVSSYGAFTIHSRSAALAHSTFSAQSTTLQSNNAAAVIAVADHYYWLFNGPAAAPFYARAEQLFSKHGDEKNALHAKIGRLRSTAESMSFVELSQILDGYMQNPVVKGDKNLRLWCLIAKGYTDLEINYRKSKQDWLEAQQIANELGEKQWAARASGELGLIGFLEGSPGRAARLIGGALLSTMTSGDTAGQIRFLELIGRGFEEVNRHGEAMRFFNRALKLADSDRDLPLPFMAYEGKAQVLMAT